MRKKGRLRLIRFPDIFIILIPLLFLFNGSKKSGRYVEIYSKGKKAYVLPISKDTTVSIDGQIGKSVVEIQNGSVRMLESACPLKICVKQGYISHSGEEIICVPNRVIIRIKGEGRIDEITE